METNHDVLTQRVWVVTGYVVFFHGGKEKAFCTFSFKFDVDWPDKNLHFLSSQFSQLLLFSSLRHWIYLSHQVDMTDAKNIMSGSGWINLNKTKAWCKFNHKKEKMF